MNMNRFAVIVVAFLLAWSAYGIWGVYTGQIYGIKGGEFGVVVRHD